MIEKHFIKQGLNKLELDDYLVKELERAGFTKSEIVKTPLVTRIVVNVTRPGLAIGKSGSNITQLTETIGTKFGIDNPQLEIREIENPQLDAQAVANKMKALIERGFAWRSVTFKTVNEIKEAGAQGLEIVLSGKIAGKAGRKRKQRISYGYMKKAGEQAKLVDYGKAAAYPKVGAIGIKVKIVRPGTIFPDKEKIEDYIKRKEEREAVKKEAMEQEKEEIKETTTTGNPATEGSPATERGAREGEGKEEKPRKEEKTTKAVEKKEEIKEAQKKENKEEKKAKEVKEEKTEKEEEHKEEKKGTKKEEKSEDKKG